jgi:hypothetical protein
MFRDWLNFLKIYLIIILFNHKILRVSLMESNRSILNVKRRCAALINLLTKTLIPDAEIMRIFK